VTAAATGAAALAGRPGPLRPYRAIISARVRMLLQYRIAAIAGVWTQVFFGFVLIMVYEAFYRSSEPVARPMGFAQVASYVWLGQALLAMLPWNADPEIRAMVGSGAVAYELCRPVDLYSLWYARAVAHRTAPTLLRAVPMTVVAAIGLPLVGLEAWRLAPPASLAAGAGFAAALVAALGLGCALSVLVNISLMWTIGGDGIVMLMSTVVVIFSGLLVPLPLLPAWAQPVLRWSPFAGLYDLPFRIYTGDLPMGALASVLARQLGWTLALVALGRWLLGRGIRRLVVQGG
jgi:ABC-2 type transport system permease protein